MKNNHALVHEHLEQLIIQANQIASDATEKLIANLNLEELSEEDKLLKLHNELKKLNQEIADFEYPEYIFLAKYKETLFRLFYGRLLFYEKNDSERIKEAIILSNKKNELLNKYLAQQKIFSDFTLDDFMNGKSNVIFYRLKQRPPGTSEEECNKMRAWQTDKLLQLIQLETNHFIETFRKNSVQDNGDIKLLDVEIEEIKLLFKRPADFAPNSKKIKALKNTLLPENLSGMTDDFIHFVDGEMDFSNLTPQNLQKAISEYLNTKTKKPVSFTPVIFYSLIIYGDWLEKVKNGELKINQNLNLDYSSLFQKTWEKGIIQSEEHIKKFKKENDLKPITANEYKEIVLKRLDNLRYAFNELSNENYYNLLTDKEIPKNQFCFQLHF